MAEVYYDRDADLKHLEGRTVAVVGYGNQGRAQALNLTDSGVSVMVGCLPDSYQETAVKDGLKVAGIAEAVQQSDIIMLLIPDEVQSDVYREHIEPHLKGGMTLSFASGYNLRFQGIVPPANIDVILMAPRTIGVTVRETFVEGSGVPADVSVWQDHSGSAWQTALALAKGVGCTRAGALKTTIEEETELDLFSEQAVWPALLDTLLTAYEVLVEKGFSPEAVALELYASGEAADIFREMAQQGLLEQLKYHSPTAQYGVLSRRKDAAGPELRKNMERALEQIRNGSFAREWAGEAAGGYPNFKRVRGEAAAHPINEADKSIRNAFQRTKAES